MLYNKYKPLFSLVTIFLMAGAIGSVHAQDSANAMGTVSIASPTAASLGKFGDIPVSYHTGIPNIDIPFYTVKAGPLSLPISLSYHASGLKVMEPASWVGAGWSLNAGGVITRTVVGQPDERGTNVGASEINGHFSDYGFSNYVDITGSTQEDWLGFAAGRKDGQPDLFFFNFGGYTGKFFFRDDRTPILVPQQDLKIVPYYPADSLGYTPGGAGAGSIQAFTVTTPDGTQYYFGNTPGLTGTPPVEVSNPYTSQQGPGGNAISSWYLNKVVSADGQFAINLSYTPENYGYFTIAIFAVNGNYANPYSPYEYNLVKNLMAGVRLSKISFPTGTVNFTAGAVRTDLSDNSAGVTTDVVNASATTLGALQISDSNGFCKQYKFNYGYFTDNTSALTGYLGIGGYSLFTDKQRLRLDSIQETSCDASLNVPPYKFSYFSEQVYRRISFAQDHWGFFNGVTNNSTLIPTYTKNGSSVNGANRDAAWPAIRGGALHQITFPTGGYTTMDFEPNYVYTSYSANQYIQDDGSTIGYDGGTAPQTSSLTLTGATDSVWYSNTCAYDATVVIKNSSNVVVQNYSIPASTAPTYTALTLSAGTYSVTLSFVSPGSLAGGTGARITFYHFGLVNVSANTMVGGLRIKTLTDNDGLTANNIVKSYTYVNNSNQSTAVLYSVPNYVELVRNDLIENVGYWSFGTNSFSPNSLNPNGCPGLGAFAKSGGSVRPMATVQGNHIGYGQVTVSQTGNGYSIYHYYLNESGFSSPPTDVCVRTITTTGCDATAPNYPAAPPPLDYKRGELYYEQHFNNGGQLLKDVYYYPSFDTTSVLTTPAFIVVYQFDLNGLLGTKYQLSTVRKTKMYTLEDDYGMNGTPTITKSKTVYYGSAFHNQPTRSVVSTSTADSLVSKTQYAFDFRLSACDAISDGTATYNSTCSNCQTTYNSARTACAGSGSCLSTAYVNFLTCQYNARVSYDSTRRLNYVNPTNAWRTCHLTAEGSADTLLKPILRLQDEYVNAPIEITEWKDTNLRHANFTRYDTSVNPLGISYPGRTKLVNLQALSNTFTSATVSGSTIAKDSRYIDETFYTFSNSNPVQVLSRSGVTQSYIWDYHLTEPVAKVSNAAQTDIAYTSFEADGKGNWSFAGAAAADASSPTGKQCYSLAGGAVSKSGLTSATSYVVSYWSKTGASYTVTGTTATTQGKTINGWTYFEHAVTGVTTITVSGTGSIDELRLYPSTAQMATYTYTPLMGMTSACDADNRITYYFYDNLGRLKWIKDQDLNIIKTIQYHYQTITGQQY
jgi:hypothetical protein